MQQSMRQREEGLKKLEDGLLSRETKLKKLEEQLSERDELLSRKVQTAQAKWQEEDEKRERAAFKFREEADRSCFGDWEGTDPPPTKKRTSGCLCPHVHTSERRSHMSLAY